MVETNAEITDEEPRKPAWQKVLPVVALVLIILLAGYLRFNNLDALGYANHYYTAAVKSMLQSWNNFFFVAAEPGGSVTVDKPPVGLWLQALSAYFLGVNGFAVLLPQLLAGMASVVVVYHLVKRKFGVWPGLLAALTLAVTPVAIATDRNNTIDSTLIFVLLLAAWAFIKATETGKWKFLLLGAFLVGVGFNIKMLEAYLPLPSFYALYFLGSAEPVWRKIGKLAVTSVLLAAVSLSWAVAVDLTPADQRPYVGSSSHNTEMDLIVGYNGLQRLLGRSRSATTLAHQILGQMDPQTAGVPDVPDSGAQQPDGKRVRPQGQSDGNNIPFIPQQDGQDNFPFLPGVGGMMKPFDGQSRNGNGGVAFAGGTKPSALRLFTIPLSKEVSWMLPFGLISILLIAAAHRWHWPLGQEHQALVLWAGWLVTALVFFSIAGFFHEYYLSTMGAPLAAVVGIGVWQFNELRKRVPWVAVACFCLAAGLTLWLQVSTATYYVDRAFWFVLVFALVAAGLGLMVYAVRQSKDNLQKVGLVCVLIGLLITPAYWSYETMRNSSANQSLPAAYSGGESGPANRGNLNVNIDLLEYLQTNTQDYTYLMAVPSSMQGADYVLATGRPVLYMGGFSGNDPVVDADDIAQMVQDHKLRFIYTNSPADILENNSVAGWVSTNCRVVEGFDTSTINAGAPDGTSSVTRDNARRENTGSNRGLVIGANFRVSLYDCAR